MKKLLWFLAGFMVFGCIAATNENIPDGCVIRGDNGYLYWYNKETGTWLGCLRYVTKKEYECGIKGHDFKFSKLSYYYNEVDGVIYHCTKCNYTMKKELDEITAEDKEALEHLGILR